MAYLDISYQTDPATGQILFDGNGYPLFGTNTGANNYGQLQARIADEVLGSPTTAQIQNAIGDAISEYERESFWFNQIRSFGDVTGSVSNFQTVAGKEFYSADDLPVLANFPHISKISVLAFNNRYALIPRTPQWMDDQSISPSWNGLPTDWTWHSNALRIYPIPNDAYPLIIDATIRFAPLTDSTDYNPWTNRGEALIRMEAKRLLFVNITRNPTQAAVMEGEIQGNQASGRQGVLAMLRRESTRRGAGPGRVRPSRGWM